MRQCFIHIGTHKTGTTSIQHLLSRNSHALQEKGYFYPKAGRLETLPGHHNLAWEISGDHRFRENYGTIGDFMREVKSRSDHIILSSEDFICSLDSRSKFSDFIALLQATGFLVTVILYLRNQVDYLPRAYLTLVRSGWDLSWRESLVNVDHCDLLRRVRENDHFPRAYRILLQSGLDLSRRESIFDIDYCDILRRVRESAGPNVIIRSYDQARTSICSDFLSIFNLTLRDLHVDREVLANVSLSLREYLLMFLHNRMRRKLLEGEEAAVNALVSPEAKQIRLSPAMRADLFRKYRDANRSLFIQCGIPEPEMEDTSRAQGCPDTPYIDELFAENIESHLVKQKW